MNNPYTILGLKYNASKEDVKKAYRKLAHIYHPDKSTGDPKEFMEISEAYRIIMKEEKQEYSYDNGRGFSYEDIKSILTN